MTALSAVARVARRYLPPGWGVLFPAPMRRRMIGVFFGSLVLAGLELTAMASLLVLMQQLAGAGTVPSAVESVLSEVEVEGTRSRLLALGGMVLGVFVVKAAVGLAFRRWVISFMQDAQAATSVRLLSWYLNGPYWKLLSRNSADMVRTMYDGTAAVYGQVVGSIIQAAVELLTITAVICFLVFAMPLPTLAAVAFFGAAVYLLHRGLRGRAAAAGKQLVDAGTAAYRATLQALAGAKEIKVRRTQDLFIEEFSTSRRSSARAGAAVGFLAEAPRYILEVLFVVAILLVSGLVTLTAPPEEALPLIAIFVAAGVRLLPSAVRVVAMSSAVRSGLPQTETVVTDLLDDLESSQRGVSDDHRGRLRLTQTLRIEDLHFRYPGSDVEVLRGVTFEVPAGSSLAVVGASGAGKSTLLDILLGLHRPTQGRICVDGQPLEGQLPSWQRAIGLVPQDVFLLDDTLRRNVTLGAVGERPIDEQVHRVLAMAHLADFVANLPDGLDTRLGERGSRVSGGQRQRIGIARALFVEPALIVLDEATSALDNESEDKVAATIRNLQGVVTTIVVAHRLSTVRHCDRVLYLDGGQIVAEGTFEEVVTQNDTFARLVELGRL